MVHSLTDKHPGYYEAILQLRDVTKDVLQAVAEEIARGDLQVTKFVKVKNGFDYYLSDNNLTKKLAKKLQAQFGGEVIITASLHTKKKNKELYRLTILFRQIHFRKDDVVEYLGEPYSIKSLGGKDILLQQQKTGKKVHVKYKDKEQIRRIG